MPDLLSFDPTWLFLSLITSGIGFVLFTYGRKQSRWPLIVGGLLFMAYPYLATTTASLVGVGVVLGLVVWYVDREGW
jgi:hypothetical protein